MGPALPRRSRRDAGTSPSADQKAILLRLYQRLACIPFIPVDRIRQAIRRCSKVYVGIPCLRRFKVCLRCIVGFGLCPLCEFGLGPGCPLSAGGAVFPRWCLSNSVRVFWLIAGIHRFVAGDRICAVWSDRECPA
ncbi:hypothetical protein AVEN_156973-1 [Araneus ventricosus]|uniref:Uncharacterized protein n=1 Tax=Araneus ventricosus TaxID=182803 RepID=A0A4Y2HKN4_ARAVE|nr:hypothetical protein AVEN_156973-1 [Araneus ventricosus]